MINEQLLSSIQHLMDNAVASGDVAGVNLLVLHNGKELLYAQSGFADLQKQAPIRKDSIFRLYSMSKPVTAAAVMILMERGIIDLADCVSQYLPGFSGQMVAEADHLVPVKRSATIRDLLSMASGLPYSGPDCAGSAAEAAFEELKRRMDSDSPIDTVSFANQLGSLPLSFHPGDHFMYGTSADILGAVVEVASGMHFGEFLKKELFDPLSMHDTGFYIPEEKQSRRALTYERLSDGSLREFPTNHLGISYSMDKPPAFESGGAGLVSTLPDYARFASMLLNGGSLDGVNILRPSTVRYMTQGSLTPWQQEDFWRGWDGLTGYSYGNLMRVMKDTGMSIMQTTPGEYGWDGWLGAYFSNHPTLGITILLGMQKRDAGTTSLTRKLRNILFSALLD